MGTPRVLASIGAVVLLAFFFLVYGQRLERQAIDALPDGRRKEQAAEVLRAIESEVSGYVLTISLINLTLGLLLTGGLLALGLDLTDALLWGTVAALLNFVPYVGPLIGVLALALVGAVAFAARRDEHGEAVGDADALEVGVAVGQRRDRPARGQAVERRQRVGIELDGIARGVEGVEGVLGVRLVVAGVAQRVLQRQQALAGEVVRVLRVLVGDAGAQFAHGRDRVLGRRARTALAQEGVERQFGALDHRPDRPEGVVEVEAERAWDGNHPRSLTRGRPRGA
jgi:hypothetical protein